MSKKGASFFKYKGSANNAVGQWTKALTDELKGAQNDLIKKLERVLDVVEEVSQQLVPIDTGATKESFYREVKIEGDKVVARAGYDRDGALSYPVYIHEIEMNWSQPGKSSRFLARGFEQAYIRIDEIMKGT